MSHSTPTASETPSVPTIGDMPTVFVFVSADKESESEIAKANRVKQNAFDIRRMRKTNERYGRAM